MCYDIRSKLRRNYEARMFMVVCTIEFCQKCRINVSFTFHCRRRHTRKVHRPNAFFNRVLTQLDHASDPHVRDRRVGSMG